METEDLIERVIQALEPNPWGAEFWAGIFSTLIGVVAGAVLSWLFARRLQTEAQEDRYGERLDDRTLIWTDALENFLGRLHDEAFADRGATRPYEPSGEVWLSYEAFRTRLRQASLIANAADRVVIADLRDDIDRSIHESYGARGFDGEFLTRARMLMAEYGNYRRGELHPSWFAFWKQGTQMPFVLDGKDPRKAAPRVNPTVRFSARAGSLPGW
ncbi:hypothetical protein [Microbacterium sp. CFBP 8794]|uniref:hypothetical protein n=1 Tax=Microbacterium sp. CFBP 8794 TaxID=2775269 RepID=UPI001780A022|nr:hypothetical protein [Microbacterium sp. CFBP 8794]MBD8477696.1 hypothetical protein [Microbacterium sp. CFBP 8794]